MTKKGRLILKCIFLFITSASYQQDKSEYNNSYFFLKINSNPFMCLDVQMHFPVLNRETNQVKYEKLFSSQWYFRLEQYNSFDKLLTKYQEHQK